jgi:hypothetical protein
MSKDRPNVAFFAVIAMSLCAAVVLVAFLIAGDVKGPKVAMNNLPSSSLAGHRTDTQFPKSDWHAAR